MVKTLTKTIEAILSQYPDARSSDKELFLALMQQYGMNLNGGQRNAFRLMPSLESARRIRQKLQEQGKYPASNRVKEVREIKSQQIQQNAPKASPERMEKLFDDSPYRRKS